MSTEANKALVRRNYAEFNRRNLAAIDEIYAPDFVARHTGAPEVHGRDQFVEFLEGYLAAFPDMQNTLHDLIAEGDKVVVRESYRGTHKGDFMGIPATGREFTFNSIDIYRIENGKIVEVSGVFDALGLMQQLGVVPSPEQVPA